MPAYVVGRDGAGGVAGDELELHVDLAVEVLVLGLEPGAGDLIEPQREELAVVEDLAAPVAPRDVHVLVEVARRAGRAGKQQQQPGRPASFSPSSFSFWLSLFSLPSQISHLSLSQVNLAAMEPPRRQAAQVPLPRAVPADPLTRCRRVRQEPAKDRPCNSRRPPWISSPAPSPASGVRAGEDVEPAPSPCLAGESHRASPPSPSTALPVAAAALLRLNLPPHRQVLHQSSRNETHNSVQ